MSTKVLSRTSTSLQKLTTDELRQVVIEALRKTGQTMFKTLTNVEFATEEVLDKTPITAGTVMEPIASALSAATGSPVQTVGEARNLMGMTQKQVDGAFCYCVNGVEISGEQAADRLDSATVL